MQAAVMPPPEPPSFEPPQQHPSSSSNQSQPQPQMQQSHSFLSESSASPNPMATSPSTPGPSMPGQGGFGYPSEQGSMQYSQSPNMFPYPQQSGNESWMYPPNFFPQQHYQNRSYPQNGEGSGNANGMNGHLSMNGVNAGGNNQSGGGYTGNRMGQSNGFQQPPSNMGYPHQPYFPAHYPQMGGPGPGTMQNGYVPYPVEGFPPFMTGPQPQPNGHLSPSPGNAHPHYSNQSQNYRSDDQQGNQPSSQMNGSVSPSPSNPNGMNDVPPYLQHPQPPAIPPPGQNQSSETQDQSQSNGQPYANASVGIPNGYSHTQSPPPRPPQHAQFQQFYPPDHPYAYGGGAGYQPFPHPSQMSGPGAYGGYGYGGQFQPHQRQNNLPYQPQSYRPPRIQGKALNPSAAGFRFNNNRPPKNFQPQFNQPGQLNSSIPSTLHSNQNPGPSVSPNQTKSDIPSNIASNIASNSDPTFPSLQSTTGNRRPSQSSQAPQADTALSNGNADPKQWSIPPFVNGEKLKELASSTSTPSQGNSQSPAVSATGLGLSQMTLQGSGAEDTPKSQPLSTLSQAASTPAMSQSTSTAISLSSDTPDTPSSIRTPKAEGNASLALSPTSPSQQSRLPISASSTSLTNSAPNPAPSSGSESGNAAADGAARDGQWSFVGPTVQGYASPTASSSTTPSIAQALTVPSTSSAAPAPTKTTSSKASKGSVEICTLKLVSGRPDPVEITENIYASSLRSSIPSTLNHTDLQVKGSSVKQEKKMPTRGARSALFGFSNGKVGRGRKAGVARGTAVTIGSIDTSEIPTQLLMTTPAHSSAVSRPAQEITLPKIKPSSWAALLRPEGSSLPSSASISPRIPSLSLDTSAAPSQAPTSPQPSEFLSPPTHSSSLLPNSPQTARPSQSQGQSGKKAVFNYAAAAAAGATMTPQEELAKLLSEGIKGKNKAVGGSIPRGLINTGNMCFANTILQVLVYCPPFAELLEELGKRLKADLARRTPLLEAMIIFLREFVPTPGSRLPPPPIAGGSHSRSDSRAEKDLAHDAFIPENVYDAMKENKRFDSMRRGYQEDAEEYLGFFLNTLHEELLFLLSRTQTPTRTPHPAQSIPNGDLSDERSIQRPVSPSAKEDTSEPWLEVGKKQKLHVVRNTETRETAVSRLFGGTIRSVLRTPGSKDSVTLEPYQPLQLDIDSPEVSSILEALKHLSQPEIVRGVWSAGRGANVDATKQVYVESFPPVLILHLKRFVYDPEEQRVVKRFKPVAYGTELVVPPEIISPGRRAGAVKYRLFGVVYHHGSSASGGHYTVSVSRQDAAGWIHFDDETVSTVPVDQVVVSPEESKEGKAGFVGGREKCAYLLFYQRVRA